MNLAQYPNETIAYLAGMVSQYDLPLVGSLFSSRGKTRSKTNLMVFIRPTILKDDAQIAELTRQRYEFMRSKQTSVMQKDLPLQREPQPALPDFETFSPTGGR
jgi:general secretion pathway protein D